MTYCAGGHFGGIFRFIFMYVLIFLETRSIFCHEILYRYSWYYTDVHCTKIFFSRHVPTLLGSILVYILLFLANHSIFSHEILYKYLQITITTLKFLIHVIDFFAGAILGCFWTHFLCVFLYFFSTFHYFHMKYCTDVFSITLTANTLKKIFTIFLSAVDLFGVFCGPYGVFWGPFRNLSH